MAKKAIGGIFIPMVTPFNTDESINFSGLREVTDFLIQNGVSGLIPAGSTGEIVALSKEEQIAVNDAVCKYADGRVKVYCSTGAYRTQDAVEMSQAAEASGADGVMVVTPWYMAPNEAELYEHYKAIRNAIKIPIMIYHNPYYSTCLMSDEFMAKLYNDGLIDSVKERQADVYRQQDLRALTDDGFGIFYGYDIAPVESLTMWADGWVCGTGNLFPAENTKVYELSKARKIEEAQKYHFEKIRPYLSLFTAPTAAGFPAPWLALFKEGLKLRGVDAGVARKPVQNIPEDVREKLVTTLRLYGYL
ncbi:MAG: dihydrodipicolinate synthase family protein [Caldilineaceae bacterium]|nr:dihydrodipicolinate synthase family protein [Caldilineaceae bacterium]MCB9138542.1 dihydrodipicolinate synthase family protein [Caldilineaceae bacterium]